jgi:nitrite reductase/ring-hydroxylating ferredoxin subunit
MGKILVGKTSEMPLGKLNKVSVDGKEVLVVNLDGNYFAMDDTCTHSGASLSEGQLDGSTVTCPWHGSTWDCKTGKLEKFPAKINDLKSYKVTVESDNIFLEA